MKQIYYILISALLAVACSKAEQAEPDVAKDGYSLKLSTRTFFTDEQQGVKIGKIRVFLFDPMNEYIVYHGTTTNGQLSVDGAGEFTLNKVAPGRYQLCVVVNEPPQTTQLLNNAKDIFDLYDISSEWNNGDFSDRSLPLFSTCYLQITPDPNHEYSALGQIYDIGDEYEYTTTGASNTVEIPLIRPLTKVSLFVRKSAGASASVVSIEKVTIHNLTPVWGYFQNSSDIWNATGVLYDGDPITVTDGGSSNNYDAAGSQIIPEKYHYDDYSNSPVKYNVDFGAYLLIHAKYDGLPCVYKVLLYDNIKANKTDYSLIRNKHYRVFANITKAGEGVIPAQIMVAGWNDGGTIVVEEPQAQPYLNVSEITTSEVYFRSCGSKPSAITKTIYFWSNQPEDQISINWNRGFYYKMGGQFTDNYDEYYSYCSNQSSNTPSKDVFKPNCTVTKTITSTPGVTPVTGKIEVEVNRSESSGNLNINLEVRFWIKAANLNRKITVPVNISECTE